MFIEGMIIAYSGPIDNTDFRDRMRHLGWLVCDGAQIERAKYPRLLTSIGVTYGPGDNSTTFNLPDLRGVFLRGLDATRGLDPDRRLGSLQMGAVQTHTHVFGNENANESGTQRAVWFATNNPGNRNNFTTEPNADGAAETRPVNMPIHYLIRADVDVF